MGSSLLFQASGLEFGVLEELVVEFIIIFEILDDKGVEVDLVVVWSRTKRRKPLSCQERS